MARIAASAAPNQAVVSIGNAVVLVLAARALDPAPFGVFASVQLVLLFCVGVANAAVLMPVLLDRTADPTRPVAELRTVVLVCGGVSGTVVALLALPTSGDVRAGVLAVAVTLPGSLFWDAVRMHYLGRSAYRKLLPGDAVAFVVATVWVAVAVALHLGLFVAACGLGVGPTVAALTVLPPWSRRWTRWERRWPLRVTANLAGDYLISTGLDQALTLLTAVFLSATVLGGFRLAQTTMGPINALALAVSLTVLPQMRDLERSAAGKLRWVSWRFGWIAVLALVIGGALTLVPVPLGQSVLGPSWAIAAPVVLPVAVFAAASAFGRAATRTMVTSGASRALVTWRAIIAPVVAAVSVLVLLRHDLVLYSWTAAGLVTASTMLLFVVAARVRE